MQSRYRSSSFFILSALGVRVFGFATEEVLVESFMYRRGFFFFFLPLESFAGWYLLVTIGGFVDVSAV